MIFWAYQESWENRVKSTIKKKEQEREREEKRGKEVRMLPSRISPEEKKNELINVYRIYFTKINVNTSTGPLSVAFLEFPTHGFSQDSTLLLSTVFPSLTARGERGRESMSGVTLVQHVDHFKKIPNQRHKIPKRCKLEPKWDAIRKIQNEKSAERDCLQFFHPLWITKIACIDCVQKLAEEFKIFWCKLNIEV